MLYEQIIKREPIAYGWSGDEKFKATAADGKSYFLRISPEARAERAKAAAEWELAASSLGVNMPRIIEHGPAEIGGYYTVSDFIEGERAELCVPTMTDERQYSLGLKSGEALKLIHSLPAPTGTPGWESRYSRKIDKKLKIFSECPIKFRGSEYITAYVEESRGLIASRPVCFQHGDYHIGNMMIADGSLYVIDFDRFDFGDPWEEFNRIPWSYDASPKFATGCLDGYFGGSVPTLFWRLLKLYIGCNILSSVAWAIPYGEKECNTMLKQAESFLYQYDNMKLTVPKWYG